MKDNKLVSAGLFAATASSLCCIMPVISIIAGSSGVISNFSWLEPFRSYFIGLTVLILGFAWFQKLKTNKVTDCACESNKKINFMQSKSFLGIITFFSIILLSFPTYASAFFPKEKIETQITSNSTVKKAEFTIKGMTCSGCEQHIKTEISKLKGITSIIVSYEKGNAIVTFDSKQVSIKEIEKTIDSIGYKSLKSKIII